MVSSTALRGTVDEHSMASATAPTLVSNAIGARRWNDYVGGHRDGTIELLWEWQRVFEQVLRQRPVYLAAERNSHVVGVLPLVQVHSALFGRTLVSLPFANYAGVLADDPAATMALISHARGLAEQDAAAYVELRNVSRQSPDLPCRTHKVGSRLSLPASSETLWNGLDRKVRNQVRKAQKSNLKVERGGMSLLRDFYRVFAHNMRDLGTPVFPRGLFEQALPIAGDGSQVFVVRHDDTPVAAAVSLRWRQTVLVPWASSLREYRNLCANMLLYWSMLEDAVAHGATTFDFGRSTRDGSTHQFKQQWGATDIPLHWEYSMTRDQPPPDHGVTSPKFALAVRMWQRLPLRAATFLGPLVCRHLS